MGNVTFSVIFRDRCRESQPFVLVSTVGTQSGRCYGGFGRGGCDEVWHVRVFV